MSPIVSFPIRFCLTVPRSGIHLFSSPVSVRRPTTFSRRRRGQGTSGTAHRPRRIPPQLSEPSDQGGTDSDIDAIRFGPKKVIISNDDDIQLSSPVRRRRTVTEAESHANHETPISSDLDNNVGYGDLIVRV
jgi:hypothetical protein